MKTRLTFIVVALMAMCAYAATTWQAAGDTPTAAGTVLVDNDLLTATTVYETTLQPSELTIADENFTHYIQVRVNKDPSAAAPAGEEYSGSTPIVVEAKKDLSLKLFYRRQSTGQTKGEDGTTAIAGDFALNDGKDVKVYDQSEFSLLGGEMTVLQTTSDFKYGYVTKVVQLKEGGKYVIAARGTTIQLFGMTAEGVEPPAPILGEAIAISPASGDISAALAEATAENPYPASVTINLAEGGEYTVGETINTIGALTLNGNGAVIDASALSGPMFAVSTTIPETLLLENGFYGLGDIAISGIEVKGLKAQLLYGNKMKFLISKVTLDNSVIGVAGGNKTVFDFNGGGVVGDLTVSNSTIWSNPAHEGQLFSTQSGQKATEAGLEMQWYRILNSTIYNISYSKNVGTHRQSNQTWLGYEVKNSLILDSGKDGQFVKGLNGGQGGKNPTWQVSGNAFQRTVEGAWTDICDKEMTDDADEPVAENVPGVVAFAGDIATGDFTLAPCAQANAGIGDPRWLKDVHTLCIEIVDESCYATFFSSLYSFELPEGLSAGVIVKSDDLYSYADYIYEPGDVVPAGVPVIIKGSMGAYPAKIVEAEGKKPEVNLLMGYDINTPKEQSADNLYYKLSRSTKNGVKKLGFFWFNKDGHYNGCEYNKAYLCRPSASEANSFVMLLEGKTDGIEAIGQNEAGEKTIFTVSGMKVDNRQLQPGIYIINGKKSVVK